MGEGEEEQEGEWQGWLKRGEEEGTYVGKENEAKRNEMK